MTEPSVFVEDVSKLKDADELKQAYVGLKDTNRYYVTTSTPPRVLFLFLLVTKLHVHCKYDEQRVVHACACGMFVNISLSCADLLGSCVSHWKSMIS